MQEKHEKVNALLRDIRLPRMVKVRQVFDDTRIEDVSGALRAQLERPEIKETVRPGMSIAITAGSRGIDNIALIIKETVDYLKSLGAEPFIVPAMGSHGGGAGRNPEKLRHHRGGHGLPDPRDDGGRRVRAP